MAVIVMSTLISVLCLPLPSLHILDFYEIFLLLVIYIDSCIVCINVALRMVCLDLRDGGE